MLRPQFLIFLGNDLKQALLVFVDWIGNGLTTMAFMPLGFVDADRLDMIGTTVLQSPRNSVFHSFGDMLPTNVSSMGHGASPMVSFEISCPTF